MFYRVLNIPLHLQLLKSSDFKRLWQMFDICPTYASRNSFNIYYKLLLQQNMGRKKIRSIATHRQNFEEKHVSYWMDNSIK